MKTGLKAVLWVGAALLAFGCSKLDVVASDSARAFEQVAATLGVQAQDGEFVFEAPDHTARFILGKDMWLETNADVFLRAGLDPAKLEGVVFSEGKLLVAQQMGLSASGTAKEAYKAHTAAHRNQIGYHAALDHYGITLAGGNLFEWAKNMKTNDKDMVFVLDPAALSSAGVDVQSVDGWVYAEVTVDDANGKPQQVYKLLKPFDLL